MGNRSRFALLALSSCFFLLLVGLVFYKILGRNDGHFIYALDDPYIHLALSDQIAHGHYGINPTDPSSPSSSILWPLLLAPFARDSFQVYMPLVLNLLFGLAAVWMIAYAVTKWPPEGGVTFTRGWWSKLAEIVLLVLASNLVGLTFLGMEHVLQVFLSIACAVGLTFAWDGERLPSWCLVAAAAAPLVRYEDIALTFAVSLVLVASHRKRMAALVFAVGALPLVAFGFFLHHAGLPALPTSVLVKGSAPTHSTGLLRTAWGIFFGAAHYAEHSLLHEMTRWPLLALSIALIYTWIADRNRTHRILLSAGIAVGLLQLTVGRFGWYNRYEIYAVIFLTILFVRSVSGKLATWSPLFLALFLLGAPYLEGVARLPDASRDIYRQQYQMHRFIDRFYRKSVAVNDLGLTSYQRPAGVYVLDVYGLGSPEAAAVSDKSATWLQQVVERHHIGLAILFPEWFNIPSTWTAVGKMCNSDPVFIDGGRCVVFYSTSADSTPEIRSDLTRFVPTLPKGVLFQFDPPKAEGGIYLPKVFGLPANQF